MRGRLGKLVLDLNTSYHMVAVIEVETILIA